MPPPAALANRRDAGIIDGKRRTFGKNAESRRRVKKKTNEKRFVRRENVSERRASVQKQLSATF